MTRAVVGCVAAGRSVVRGLRTRRVKECDRVAALETELAKIGVKVESNVLGDKDGNYTLGERGDVVWIWEIRLGHLEESDFSVSNTAGDSGKTAVVKTESLRKMGVLYVDPRYIPYKGGEKWYRAKNS